MISKRISYFPSVEKTNSIFKTLTFEWCLISYKLKVQKTILQDSGWVTWGSYRQDLYKSFFGHYQSAHSWRNAEVSWKIGTMKEQWMKRNHKAPRKNEVITNTFIFTTWKDKRTSRKIKRAEDKRDNYKLLVWFWLNLFICILT